MVVCAVFGCNHSVRNAAKLKLRFFSFPRDVERANKWAQACKRSDEINIKNASICSSHFTEEDYDRPLIYSMLNYSPKNRRRLKVTAIPTQNLPNKSIDVTEANSNRATRIHKRNQKKVVKDLLISFNENAKYKPLHGTRNENLNGEIEKSQITQDVTCPSDETTIFESQTISVPGNDVLVEKDTKIKKLEKQLSRIKALWTINKIAQREKFRQLRTENSAMKKKIADLEEKCARWLGSC